MPDQRLFRRVAGRFATGVAIVTARGDDGSPSGLTANSFSSVSLDPPLVLVCLGHEALTLASIRSACSFGISFLGADDGALARRFARPDRGARFQGLELTTRVTGSPLLARSHAWMDCDLHALHTAGDHEIVVGRVREAGVGTVDTPLVFHGSAYRRLAT